MNIKDKPILKIENIDFLCNEEYNDVVFWRISWENKNHLLL